MRGERVCFPVKAKSTSRFVELSYHVIERHNRIRIPWQICVINNGSLVCSLRLEAVGCQLFAESTPKLRHFVEFN